MNTTTAPRNATPHHPAVLHSWLMLAAGAIAIVGYFGPWVPHRAAGLVILGLDLAEYVKFVPQVTSGQIGIRRELFYLPLFATSFGASLLASQIRKPGWLRGLLALIAIPLALAMLPPAWKPTDLLTPEYRPQALAILICLLAIPGAFLMRRLGTRFVLGAVGGLAVLAGSWPAWTFLKVQPAIAAVYHDALPLGWGFWACLLGFLSLAMLAFSDSLRSSR